MNKLLLALSVLLLSGCAHTTKTTCPVGYTMKPTQMCLQSNYTDEGLDIYYDPCNYKCAKAKAKKI